jgi:hypothetical protein
MVNGSIRSRASTLNDLVGMVESEEADGGENDERQP